MRLETLMHLIHSQFSHCVATSRVKSPFLNEIFSHLTWEGIRIALHRRMVVKVHCEQVLLFTKTEFHNQAIMKRCTVEKMIGCNCNNLVAHVYAYSVSEIRRGCMRAVASSSCSFTLLCAS